MAAFSYQPAPILSLLYPPFSPIPLSLSQEQSHTIAPLFKEFVFSFCEEEQSELHPVLVLR